MNKVYIMLPITYMIIELSICYICVTLGAQEGLDRFDCYMIEDGIGGYELKFVLKEGVPEAIGAPYAASYVND